MLFIQAVCGCPGGRLQFSGGGPKTVWLASAFSSIRARYPKKVRRRDLAMDESGVWLVVRQLCTAVSPAEVAEPIECGGVRVSLTGFRLAGNTKCMSDIELWKKILHPNLVQLREVFTTKAFGDNCM